MADSGFQATVLDGIAKVVGGAVSSVDAHFYSGAGGVAGVKGCWATIPNGLGTTPVGVVYPGPFAADLASLGEEDNEDMVPLVLYVAPDNTKTSMAVLTPFRDLVPAAFRAHMWAFNTPGALDFFVLRGEPGVHEFAGTKYLAWRFTVRVRRMLAVSYTA